jgi:hypothetical protein
VTRPAAIGIVTEAKIMKWRIVAAGTRANTRAYCSTCGGDKDGEHQEAALSWSIAAHGLIVNRQVVFEYVASTIKKCNEDGTGNYGTVLNDADREDCSVAPTELIVDEGSG